MLGVSCYLCVTKGRCWTRACIYIGPKETFWGCTGIHQESAARPFAEYFILPEFGARSKTRLSEHLKTGTQKISPAWVVRLTFGGCDDRVEYFLSKMDTISNKRVHVFGARG